VRLHLQNKNKKWTGRMAQAVEHCFASPEFKPQSHQKKKKKKKNYTTVREWGNPWANGFFGRRFLRNVICSVKVPNIFLLDILNGCFLFYLVRKMP
jgi:hypothetical protein